MENVNISEKCFNFTIIDIVVVVGADSINKALYYFSLNKFCENKKNITKKHKYLKYISNKSGLSSNTIDPKNINYNLEYFQC